MFSEGDATFFARACTSGSTYPSPLLIMYALMSASAFSMS